MLLEAEGIAPPVDPHRCLPRILGAGLVMVLGLWLAAPWLAELPPPLALALLIAAGGLGFLLLGQLAGALDFGQLRQAVGKRRT